MKTGSDTTTYTNDGQDHLIKVQVSGLPGSVSTYTFDGDGMRRTAQEGNVQPTTMVWDGNDYLFLDGPSSDSLVLTLDGEIVACGSKDLLTDPLGSLLREISTGASLSSAFSFYPYGSPVAGTTPTIPFRFIAAYGYYFDTNDRDYVRARDLEKRLGRWMQTDPFWPDERAFGYVGGRPVRDIDQTGLMPLLGGAPQVKPGQGFPGATPLGCRCRERLSIPGGIDGEVRAALRKCIEGETSVEQRKKCIHEVIKKYRGKLNSPQLASLYSYIGCLLGIHHGGTQTLDYGLDRCKKPEVNCDRCCGGHWEMCAILCLDRPKDKKCLTKCNNKKLACTQRCEEPDGPDPWK